MARYYFHLCDGADILPDPDGRTIKASNLPVTALREAREIIAADARTGRIYLDQCIEVHDEAGKIVHRIAFEDAVHVTHEAVRRS